MSRYVLSQDQLDRLQNQIQQLTRLNDTKQERIRELELHKTRVSNTEAADLLRTIGRLESEISDLKKTNELLQTDVNASRANAVKINDLKILLEEEQRLRKYSEMLVRQMELKCAEETLIRQLTTELCQLQKVEIDIDNKRIRELQDKLKSHKNDVPTPRKNVEKAKKQIINSWSEENFLKNKQLRFITEQLKSELNDLHMEIQTDPMTTEQNEQKVKEIEKWLMQAHILIRDIGGVEQLKKDLKLMREEIDNKIAYVSK